MRLSSKFFLLSVLSLTACQVYQPTPKPDYTIQVIPTAKGMTAIPPTCPNWATDITDPYDNQPVPQFGCATARNLAMMTENPEDLVKGRDLGETRGVLMVGAIRRYDNNQTRGLLSTSSSLDNAADVTTSPASSSTMTGDVTGSTSGGSSSSSSSSSSTSTGP